MMNAVWATPVGLVLGLALQAVISPAEKVTNGKPKIEWEYDMVGQAKTIEVQNDENVDGFIAHVGSGTMINDPVASNDFLTDSKVGSQCNAWAYVGGTSRTFNSRNAPTQHYMSIGSVGDQGFNVEFRFCEPVRITLLNIGTVHHGHNAESGTLQYRDEDGQWHTVADGKRELQRNFRPSWHWGSTYGWKISNAMGGSTRWRVHKWTCHSTEYISGFHMTYAEVVVSATQYLKLSDELTIKVQNDENVDGFIAHVGSDTMINDPVASNDFLTDSKVGSQCNAWAYVGGTSRSFNSRNAPTQHYMSIGSVGNQGFNVEFRFCEPARITLLNIGTVHHGHNAESGTLQYRDEDGQWQAVADGKRELQRNFRPSWHWGSTYGWKISNSVGVSTRWRVHKWTCHSTEYISGFDMTFLSMSAVTREPGTSWCRGQPVNSGKLTDCESIPRAACNETHTPVELNRWIQCGVAGPNCLAVGPICTPLA